MEWVERKTEIPYDDISRYHIVQIINIMYTANILP